MAQDQKRELIIQAAQKRFAHFGVGKTTMTEIADDVSMSKASLYYYFPDKLNLYAAVIEHIIRKEEDSAAYATEGDALKAILLYLERRTQFLLKYYNILEYLRTLSANIPDELKTTFSLAGQRQLQTITTIIKSGIASKQISTDHPEKTAELLHDCLEGLRHSGFANKANFFPDKKQFEALLKREKELAAIFFRGLKP